MVTARHGLMVGFFALVLLGPTFVGAQGETRLDTPRYSLEDRWEYLVDGQLAGLPGLIESAGEITVGGLATGRVSSAGASGVTLSWTVELGLEGSISFQLNETTFQANLTGTIRTSQADRYQVPEFLPREAEATTGFDFALEVLGVPLPFTAASEVTTTHTPQADYPTYPLSVGEMMARFPTAVRANFTSVIAGIGFQNQTETDANTTLRLSVASPSSIAVPAGNFSAFQVQAELLEGMASLPLLGVFPADRQIGYYSNEAGNAVLVQFFLQEQLLGNATLRTFTYAPPAEIPFWQQPLFLVSLLAIPIVVLVLLYWRERRKGL